MESSEDESDWSTDEECEEDEELDIVISEDELDDLLDEGDDDDYLIVLEDDISESLCSSEDDSSIQETLIEDDDPCHVEMSENQLYAASQIQAQYKKAFEKASPELKPFLMRYMKNLDAHINSARQALRAKYANECIDG